jgi:aryl-alcohol dehydrogenase-like predicted oxidoreductase
LLTANRANNYQAEDSEKWVGEWMETRGVRDQIVLATKYTTGFRTHVPSEIQANFVGNNAKSMKLSVDASLKKLRTDYIDLVRTLRTRNWSQLLALEASW